jgi:hypothetical protein
MLYNNTNGEIMISKKIILSLFLSFSCIQSAENNGNENPRDQERAFLAAMLNGFRRTAPRAPIAPAPIAARPILNLQVLIPPTAIARPSTPSPNHKRDLDSISPNGSIIKLN